MIKLCADDEEDNENDAFDLDADDRPEKKEPETAKPAPAAAAAAQPAQPAAKSGKSAKAGKGNGSNSMEIHIKTLSRTKRKNTTVIIGMEQYGELYPLLSLLFSFLRFFSFLFFSFLCHVGPCFLLSYSGCTQICNSKRSPRRFPRSSRVGPL